MLNRDRSPALEKARQVRLMAFDIDGTLTDGRLYIGPQGEVMKVFHAQDGLGLKKLQSAGVQVALITARTSPVIQVRAKELGIDRSFVCEGVSDKVQALRSLLGVLSLTFSQSGFMGDDDNDAPVMKACGFGATFETGSSSVLEQADWIVSRPPGQGGVRELCEFILESRSQ